MKLYMCALFGSVGLAAAPISSAQDATILNARIAIGDGPVIQRGYILVRQGRIVTVGPGRPAQLIGSVIDASGMTALPGLVDGHKHINTGPYEKEQMTDMIENGFTTVLSGGGPAEGAQALAQHIDSGLINGPRVIPSARLLLTTPPDQGRAAIREMASHGIKFTGEMPVTPVPSATPGEIALLQAVVDEGKKAGVSIMVHAVSTPAMVAATRAGVRHQVHLPNKDFMGYDDAAYIAGTGTIVLDLISFGDPIIDVFQKDDVPRFRTGLRWPESIAGANRDDNGRALGTEGAYTLINARRLWDASHGRGLGFGSDQGYAVHDVLEHELKSLMVMFSMQDVIRIITINTATFLDMQDEIGTIAPKKRADIVLVRGNPFDEFNDLLNTRVVLKDGKVVVDKRSNRESPDADKTSTAPTATSLVGTLTADTAHPDQPPVIGCAKLTTVRLSEARVRSARQIPATSLPVPASSSYDQPAHAVAVPARCEVEVQLQAAKGVTGLLHLWLPDLNWNAALLISGGSARSSPPTDALAHGYAVASIGTGERAHTDLAAQRSEPGSLAMHGAAAGAKALIGAYYGASPRYSYWERRSAETGPALATLRAYPTDFDGVVGGAPDGTPGANVAAADLSAFAARGGKLIEYHGGDAQPGSTQAAIENYREVTGRPGGGESAQDFYRLFLLPAGEKGDSYRVNWLVALDEWVQRGRAPDVVLAEHFPPANEPPPPPPKGVVFEPPFGLHVVCAYPMVAQTTGGQGAETPLDYMCVTASRAAEVAGAKR